MKVTIINDCNDDNAKGRQEARTLTLFDVVHFIGVNSDLEAAGNIIDILDAIGDASHCILVNVAPRNGRAKKFENGTPFGYIKIKNATLVSTIDGLTLSLLKKLKLADKIHVIDLPKAAGILVEANICSRQEAQASIHGQFRSFDFLPFVGAYVAAGNDLPSEELTFTTIEDAPASVWWIDSFGNCKTTITSDEVTEKEIKTTFGTFEYIEQLKNVPDGKTAVTKGSSGFGEKRFIEVVIQGANAAKKHGIASGVRIV